MGLSASGAGCGLPGATRPREGVQAHPFRVLVDGVAADRLPVSDRAIGYGDGLFETLLIRRAGPCQWRRHLDRLEAGCARLGIPVPARTALESEVRALTADTAAGVLKVLITRGSGGRGYRPPPVATPSRVLAIFPEPAWPEPWASAGVCVCYCRTPVSENRVLAGIKHLNRLDSVLARAEWDDPQVGEGLMLGADGRVVGGTMSNLFLWTGSALLTPRLDRAGISGTVRALTMATAERMGIECRELDCHPPDLRSARGLFLTNALIGIWPVRHLDGRDYAPGLLPQDLLQAVVGAAQTVDG